MEAVLSRGASTIPSPEILDKPPEYQEAHKIDDAFRTRNRGLTVCTQPYQGVVTFKELTVMVQLAYLAWSSAAALFEDFARMGLTTASAIERAYKKDTKLLWRIVACFSRVEWHAADLWGKLSHAVSYSEHFQPYFKRWRVGLAHNHCMSTLITNE